MQLRKCPPRAGGLSNSTPHPKHSYTETNVIFSY